MSDKDKDGNVDKPKSAVSFFVILLLVLVFGLDPALLPLVNLLLLILLRDFPQSVEVLFLLAPADWPDLLLLVGLLLFIAPGLVDRPDDVVLFPVLDVVVLVECDVVDLFLLTAPGLLARPDDVVLFPVLDVVVLVDFALLPKHVTAFHKKEWGYPHPLFEA